MTTVLAAKTTLAPKLQAPARWFLVNADGLVLGRLATAVATVLMGKHKTLYTPHVDVGDFVVVVNAEKVKITGRKMEQKYHDYFTYHPGGRKVVSYKRMMERHPERIIELAVRRMLPKTRMGRAMYKKLKVYPGPDHTHQAQQPITLDLSEGLANGLAKLTH